MNLITMVSSSLCLFTSMAWAQSDKVCTELQKFSCAPGIYNDGTGAAGTPDTPSPTREAFQEKISKIAAEKFKAALVDPENKTLRQAVLSASNLDVREDCENAEESPQGECLDLMLQYTVQMFNNGDTLFRPQTQKGKMPKGDIDERYFLLSLKAFQETREDILKHMRAELGADDLDIKIRKVATKVKELLIVKANAEIADPSKRKIVIDRIKAAQPSGSNCKSGIYSSIPEITAPGAFYHSSSRNLYYCYGNATSNTSEFYMAFSVAHEIAHSFDPCNIAVGPKAFSYQYKAKTYDQADLEYPLPGLIRCLRNPSSSMAAYIVQMPKVNAREIDSPDYPDTSEEHPPVSDQYPAKRADHKGPPFKDYCENDQIGEAASDWWTFEVLPEYIQSQYPDLKPSQYRIGYSNIGRSHCNEAESKDFHNPFDVHPTFKRRLDFLVLSNPKIREQMGCPQTLPEGRVYCDGKVPTLTSGAPGKGKRKREADTELEPDDVGSKSPAGSTR